MAVRAHQEHLLREGLLQGSLERCRQAQWSELMVVAYLAAVLPVPECLVEELLFHRSRLDSL